MASHPVKSLFELAAGKLKSPTSKLLSECHEFSEIPDVELGVLRNAEGRVCETGVCQIPPGTNPEYFKDRTTPVIYNSFGRIDSARLLEYDPEHKIITIRVDHSETPSFWLQLEIPLDQLNEWLSRQ